MTKKVTAYGNAVVEVGMYTITMVIPGMPQPVSDEGKYLTVWLKQSDGSYKIVDEIWNTNVHPMKGAPKADPSPALDQNPTFGKDPKKDKGETKSGGTTKSGKTKSPTSSDDKK
jgi:hypothetical protein